MNRRPSPGEAGFSLLEALIAVAILAAIAAVLMPAVGTAVRIEARAAGRISAMETNATAEALMRDLLLHAVRSPQAAAGNPFTGARNQMHGLTLGAGSTRPARVSLMVDSGRLELAVSSDEPGFALPEPVVLAENVADAEFSYFGLDEATHTAAWYRRWDSITPPRLVRLELTGIDGSVQTIEALVGGTGAYDCRFDSGRGVCLGDNE